MARAFNIEIHFLYLKEKQAPHDWHLMSGK
jgi:hypothetical protein